MSKLATAPDAFERKLRKALRDGLKAAGLDANIDMEPIRGTKLRRVHVTSAAFDKLRPSERQDLVWRIVGFTFPQEDQLKISMILTLSPRELQGK
jgi:hypothetical protein